MKFNIKFKNEIKFRIRNFSTRKMSTSKLIKVLEHGKTGIIQLNRPDALNAINLEMWKNMHKVVSLLEIQKDLVVVKGNGKVFCAGADVKEMTSSTPDDVHLVYSLGSKTFDRIRNYKKPFVSLIDGLTMVGASVYGMPGKYRVATERTCYAMPETLIGYYNNAGSSYFLSRSDNNFGIYVGLTGNHVKGYDVKKVGLATHYVESDKLDELERNLTRCKSHSDVERILTEHSSDPQCVATELDEILPNIKKCFSGATMEEIFANLENEDSKWAKSTLAVLKLRSPTSLKVSHRSLLTGKNISARDCLRMELILGVNYCTDSADLKEGVRALLVEKDLKPKWSRKSIYEVTDEDVEILSKPVPKKHELIFDDEIRDESSQCKFKTYVQ